MLSFALCKSSLLRTWANPVARLTTHSGIPVITKISEFKEWRAKAKGSVGFVPTMGYLHAGHLSLVEQSKKSCDHTVVSIFVNRTQFAPHEDFDSYPRDIARDCKLLEGLKPDVVFAPEPKEMYPDGYKTYVEVHDLQHKQEGVFRPTFFRGVATVVVKLFNIVGAQKAFFGQKDAQQCIVVKKFVDDLNLPVDVVVCPTKREPDGLAMSSRNVYLSSEQRKEGESTSATFRSTGPTQRPASTTLEDSATLKLPPLKPTRISPTYTVAPSSVTFTHYRVSDEVDPNSTVMKMPTSDLFHTQHSQPPLQTTLRPDNMTRSRRRDFHSLSSEEIGRAYETKPPQLPEYWRTQNPSRR